MNVSIKFIQYKLYYKQDCTCFTLPELHAIKIFLDLSLNYQVNLSENTVPDTQIVLHASLIRFSCRFPRMLMSSSSFDVTVDPDGSVFQI